MASTNTKTIKIYGKTFEGAPATFSNDLSKLRRAVLSCMLWEDQFYEDGQTIAQRIKDLSAKVNPIEVAKLAIDARSKYKIRHASLLLARELVRHPQRKQLTGEYTVANVIANVVQRADELTEFLSLYWLENKEAPIASQVKKGLAKAFTKFNAYNLAKYNRDKDIKLRDVAFLVHPKPIDQDQAQTFAKLVNKDKFPIKYQEKAFRPLGQYAKLDTPETWEVLLSEGADKKESFTKLIKEDKLGALALIRNLRKMQEVKVDVEVIRYALNNMKVERVLPYRFITAAKYAPNLEPELEKAMFKCIEGMSKLPGNTLLLVDVSGSMDSAVSDKSESTRIDCACGLAILARELCQNSRIYAFSDNIKEVPNRRGFALRDAIKNSMPHNGTMLGTAVQHLKDIDQDRVIVFTDEQSADKVPSPTKKGYMINVASAENGVGYGPWVKISGFSEATLDFIQESENLVDGGGHGGAPK